MILVDEEAEYRKIYKNRKGPSATSTATTLVASGAEAAIIPSASLAKKTVKKHCAGTLYSLTKRMGKLADKVAIMLQVLL